MKHAPKTLFQGPAERKETLSLVEAIDLAKSTVSSMTGSDIDAVVQCSRDETNTAAWQVTVDVLESRARIGDNDLLSAYEIHLGATGELLHFERVRRYHREDRGAT